MTTKLYLFNWKGGGYNTVNATSKKGAIAEIKKKFGTEGPCSAANAINIRIPKKGEVEALDEKYRGMFD